jgi:ATP-binding cassette subfamily B protein
VFEPNEQLLAVVESDLNHELRFGKALAVLTSERLLLWPTFPQKRGETPVVRSWPMAELAGLRTREQAGLGTLDFLGPTERLVSFRYTAGRSSQIARFLFLCNQELARRRGETLDVLATVCPSCGTVLHSGENECPACTQTGTPQARSLFRLWRFARPHYPQVALGLFLTLACTVAAVIGPFLSGRLIDQVLVPNFRTSPEAITVAAVAPYLYGMLGAAILAWLLGWAKSYVLANATEYIVSEIRQTTFNHLQRLSLEFFGGKRTGDLIARVSSDSDKICQFLSVQMVEFSADVLMIAITTVVLVSKDPFMAIVTLLPFPAIAWLIQLVRTRLRHYFAYGNKAWSEMVSVLADTIPGIRVVKAFAQEQRESERFRDADEYVRNANIRVNRIWAFFTPIIALLTEVGLLVIWAFGAWQVRGQSLTVGDLMVFVALIGRFYLRLESMSRMVASAQRATTAAHRIFEILDRVPSVAEPVRPVHPGRVKGQVELKAVRFSYGKREVIKGIDLLVQPGEMIGLVGPSGAGKSTLVNLVCRFFDVASGGIFVDGTDIRSFPTQEYRSNIGIVLQDPFLFYGTIGENIAYGRPGATRGEIVAAARAARAHEFILRLPDGYDSLVGERGQALSGGERQRISIARALLTDPRLLILDEATSSVDTETEHEIQEALDVLTRGRTTIAIAHRLSTLRNASRIVVMESGQITEIGSHEELLRREGTYWRLCQSQNELTHGR